MFVQPEGVLPTLLVRNRMALRENGQGNGRSSSLQNNVRGRGIRSGLANQLQTELQQTVVGRSLIAQESVRGHKVHVLTAMRSNANALAVLVELEFWLHPGALNVNGSPAFNVLVEARQHRHRPVGISAGTLRGVSIAEAGRASEAVVQIQVEESRLAVTTMGSLNVVLADTYSGLRVARRCVVQRTSRVTVARRAPVVAKVVEVRVATVTLFSSNSWLALALALSVALQGTGSSRVAVAVIAVTVGNQVVIVFATFAVGSITVGSAVHAVSSVASQVVQVLVEEALGRITVAVAG